jgi:PBP1b-binding outer membrane lipoprotein LpoB
MRYLLIALLLAGCASTPVPVTKKFPNATPELMKKCEDLKKIEGDKVSITDMLKVVVHNYSLYYECSTKVDGWQEWYAEQKKIHDEASK